MKIDFASLTTDRLEYALSQLKDMRDYDGLLIEDTVARTIIALTAELEKRRKAGKA